MTTNAQGKYNGDISVSWAFSNVYKYLGFQLRYFLIMDGNAAAGWRYFKENVSLGLWFRK